jgi:phosphonate transport system substrate-binding protein
MTLPEYSNMKKRILTDVTQLRSRKFMKRTAFLCALLLTVALSLPSRAAEEVKPKPKLAERPLDAKAAPLNIAFISYANPQQVARDSEGVTKYLQKYLGVPVKGFVTLDYGSAIEAMRNEKADLAFVDPLAFMMAHEQIGARPLLLEIYRSGKPSYHSCIWVRKDSGLKQIADLRGKSIAFADQVDMSGHLMPRDVFVRAGLLPAKRIEGEFFKQIYFAGGDEQAMRAMFNGFTEAAGVSQYSINLLRGEERDKVMALTNSIESPSHLLMARPRLSAALVERIKQVLLALDKTNPADKAMLDKLYGVQGYAEAKLSDFSEIAKVAAGYGFVKKPEIFSAPAKP